MRKHITFHKSHILLTNYKKNTTFARFFCTTYNMNRKFIGYIAGILAAAFYGLNPLFALPLYEQGIDTISVLFFRYILALPFLAIPMVIQHISFRLTTQEALQLLLLGILMATSSLLLYEAYKYMDAGIASTILFLYPIITALLMAIVFHERIHWIVWACLLLATIGVFILCDMTANTHITTTGIILVILSTIMYAAYLVFINKGHITTMPPIKTTFYALLTGTILLATILLIQGHINIPQGTYWGCSIASALLSTAISLSLTAVAIQRIGSTHTAILGAMEPITALLIGVSVFHEQLTLRAIIGIIIIIAAVTLAIAKK